MHRSAIFILLLFSVVAIVKLLGLLSGQGVMFGFNASNPFCNSILTIACVLALCLDLIIVSCLTITACLKSNSPKLLITISSAILLSTAYVLLRHSLITGLLVVSSFASEKVTEVEINPFVAISAYCHPGDAILPESIDIVKEYKIFPGCVFNQKIYCQTNVSEVKISRGNQGRMICNFANLTKEFSVD